MSERVDNSSDIPTLKEVIDELGVFERWYPLGIHLKLVHPVLKAITRDEHGTEMRCITMIEKWLDSKTNPSWSELCKALRDMKEHALADSIARKYCPEMCAKCEQLKPAIPCEQQPHASNDPLVECQLPLIPEDDDDASEKQPFDVAFEFAYMFSTVVDLLDEAINVKTLNRFLKSLCHMRTQVPYVSPKLYEHCTTTAKILESLQPQFINPMHLYLLKKIVDKFGCDQAKELVRQFDTSFPRDIPLKRLGDPLTDEEIEACVGTKKLKVVVDRDPNGVTKRDVEVYQGVIVRNTGIPPEVIVYAKHTTGSVVLVFLIPEGTTEAFISPTVDSLLFLLGSGVVKMEVDGDICNVLGRLGLIVEVEERPVPVILRWVVTGSSAGSAMLSDSGYGSRTGSSAMSLDSGYGSRTGSSAMSLGSGYESSTGSSAVPLQSGYRVSGVSEAVKLAKILRGNPAMKDLDLSGNHGISDGGIGVLAGCLSVNQTLEKLNLRGNYGMSDEGVGVLAGCLHVNQTLEKLNLHNTRLSDRGVAALTDGLCNNRGLRELNLSRNQRISDEGIGVLAGCLRVNQTLEKLDLSFTSLSDRGVAPLADGLCNNRGLRELDLSWNYWMSDEGVGVFAGCLRVNQTLEKLNLSFTSLSDRGVAPLADGLCNNRGLRELDLSWNYGMSDEGVGVFAGCLRVNQTLEKLNLHNTRLSDRGVAALTDGLCNNRGLRELNLSWNDGISDEGVGVFAGCLRVNQTLEKLDLSLTSLSDRGVAALTDGLCNNRGLRELDLSRNQRISDEGIGVLAGCLRVNQTLEKLDLSLTSLSDRGVAALTDGLCNNRGLRELKLSGNPGISDEGIGVFAGCLHVNQTLERLDLRGSSLSDGGVAVLADGLCNNRGLRELNLSWNDGISDEGVGVFAGCLRVNQTLEKLDLSLTSLSDRGVAALTDGLCNNRGLRELDLSRNQRISDEGIGVLAGCLRVNQTLEKLDLSLTSLSDRGVAALTDGLCNNRGLRELKLSGNPGISDEGIGVFAGCLHVNQTLERLDLRGSSLSDGGVAVLADGLCNNRGLRELKLPKSISVDMRRRLEDIAREKEELTIYFW